MRNYTVPALAAIALSALLITGCSAAPTESAEESPGGTSAPAGESEAEANDTSSAETPATSNCPAGFVDAMYAGEATGFEEGKAELTEVSPSEIHVASLVPIFDGGCILLISDGTGETELTGYLGVAQASFDDVANALRGDGFLSEGGSTYSTPNASAGLFELPYVGANPGSPGAIVNDFFDGGTMMMMLELPSKP